MAQDISTRLLAIVDALPLAPGMRVLEIGCGPGAMAREMARRIGAGKVVAIDRSAKAIALARAGSAQEMASGLLEFRQSAIEGFALETEERPFDLAVAVRVGALDGRHPQAGEKARAAIARALGPASILVIDGRQETF
ncbi:SAM-dependent methyltransferase [Pelagibacterium sp.]|uniref:SAM-dependent methyltransferase n=1 Tax=Pelagibacterium sp. TaxID=1967288 RepID=UPI003BAB3C44